MHVCVNTNHACIDVLCYLLQILLEQIHNVNHFITAVLPLELLIMISVRTIANLLLGVCTYTYIHTINSWRKKKLGNTLANG